MSEVKLKPTKENQDRIVETVCKKYDVSKQDLMSKKRHKRISDARHEIMIRFVYHLGMTTTATAIALNRDHSTVIYACSKIGQFNIKFYEEVETKKSLINSEILELLIIEERSLLEKLTAVQLVLRTYGVK